MILWDSVDALINYPADLPSRRIHRDKKSITIRSFIHKWMMLAGCLIVGKWITYSGTILSHNIISGILQIKYREIQINNLVELTPRLLEQYHYIRYNEVLPRDTTTVPHQFTGFFQGKHFMFDALSTASTLPPLDTCYECMEHI